MIFPPGTVWPLLGAGAIALAFAGPVAGPALAEERGGINLVEGAAAARAGGVAQFALAQDLYAMGMRVSDALLVVAAARIASGVAMTDVTRARADAGSAPDALDPQLPPDADRMLADARDLAGGDEVILSMIDDVEADARGRIGGASREVAVLAAGARDVWRVPFYGEVPAEIGVSGSGGAALSILVEDENANRIWCPSGLRASFYCDFTPRWNGFFHVTIFNAGGADSAYVLLTN